METTVASHLHTFLDHETILTLLPSYEVNGPLSKGRLKYDACDTKLLQQLLVTFSNSTSTDTESNAENLKRDLTLAVNATTPDFKVNSRGAPWRTEDCRKAFKASRRVRRTGPAHEEQQALRKAVRLAKSASWRSKVDNAKDLPSVCKIVK